MLVTILVLFLTHQLWANRRIGTSSANLEKNGVAGDLAGQSKYLRSIWKVKVYCLLFFGATNKNPWQKYSKPPKLTAKTATTAQTAKTTKTAQTAKTAKTAQNRQNCQNSTSPSNYQNQFQTVLVVFVFVFYGWVCSVLAILVVSAVWAGSAVLVGLDGFGHWLLPVVKKLNKSIHIYYYPIYIRVSYLYRFRSTPFLTIQQGSKHFTSIPAFFASSK